MLEGRANAKTRNQLINEEFAENPKNTEHMVSENNIIKIPSRIIII
jgi:hypothetical protein